MNTPHYYTVCLQRGILLAILLNNIAISAKMALLSGEKTMDIQSNSGSTKQPNHGENNDQWAQQRTLIFET